MKREKDSLDKYFKETGESPIVMKLSYKRNF